MSRFLKTKAVTQEYSTMSPKKFCPEGSGPSSLTNRVDELKVMFENRLNAIEKKMDLLITACSSILSSCEDPTNSFGKPKNHVCCASLLLPKIIVIEEYVKNSILNPEVLKDDSLNVSAPVVLVPSGKPPVRETSGDQVISLNSEKDLPDGSWLGDENDPKGRVRVNIPPSSLIHMNERCQTPEKMALALLDYLFPREVQAVSNISGKGKHYKSQLDPLKIYAIRCHLVHKFSITEQDWYRIKQNINAKCRSVWRKKVSGLPLETTKPNFPPSDLNQSTDVDSDDSFNPAQVFDDSSKSILDDDLQLTSLQDDQIKLFTGDSIETIRSQMDLIPSEKPFGSDALSEELTPTFGSELELPDGSWLGDKNDPKERVRVNIPPSALIHLNNRCHTPEKMALTLLDYLFPREVQATSNISGKGNGKVQLDPNKIHAIKCHLVHKFNITEQDWYRIKQNINSKCRTMCRKKINGLSIESNKPLFCPPSDVNHSDAESDDSFNPTHVPDDSSNNSILGADQHFTLLQDGQGVKVFTDEEIKDFLHSSWADEPTAVGDFSVDDAGCFTLVDQKLLSNGDSLEKSLEDDANPLLTPALTSHSDADFASEKPDK